MLVPIHLFNFIGKLEANRTYSNYLSAGIALMLFTAVTFPQLFGVSVLLYIAILSFAIIKREVFFKIDLIGWLFITFYGLYLLGTIHTEHWDIASKTLEYKLSFILFPLLLAFKPKAGRYDLRLISSALIIALLLITCYGFINSIICYSSGGGRACFLTVIVSPVHHPSYFLTFWITGLAFAWYGFRTAWKGYHLTWIISFTLLGIVSHVLSLSLAGILFLLIVAFAAALSFVLTKFGRITALIALILLPILGFLIITKTPQVEGEYHGAKFQADQYLLNPEEFIKSRSYPMSGSEVRLVLWTVAARELRENPMGLGTGNMEMTLFRSLNELNQKELAKQNLNPHNQFLQTGLEIGYFGIAVLIFIILYGTYLGFKSRNRILIVVSACLGFNCLFESMLQRQSGVVFFTLILCLLASSALELKTSPNIHETGRGN